MRRAIVLLVALAGIAHADECPETQAGCALQAEGARLLLDGQFRDAATKFTASIAAAPSARAYLGYSQALEGLGDTVLACDAMMIAKRFSDREIAETPDDVVRAARAERIKYKLGELTSKSGVVRITLAPGLDGANVLSVAWPEHGEISDPLGRDVCVQPQQQTLDVTFRDGARTQIDVRARPGTTTTVLVAYPAPAIQPRYAMPTYFPVDTGPRWVTTPPPERGLSIAGVALVPNAGSLSGGVGVMIHGESRLNTHAAITANLTVLLHPRTYFETESIETSGDEEQLLVGLRSARLGPIFATVEAGAARIAGTADAPMMGDRPALHIEDASWLPTFAVGGGLAIKWVELRAGVSWTIGGELFEPGVRVYFGAGVHLGGS